MNNPINGRERLRLVDIIKQSAFPLFAIPVELPPAWESFGQKIQSAGPFGLGPVRAVIFDLYGTLFISAAGEIAGAENGGQTWRAGGFCPAGSVPAAMKNFLQNAVAAEHGRAKTAGKAFPEVRLEELWALWKGKIPSAWGPVENARELALHYELAVNPVYPMPGALETITVLHSRGFVLGIISNAQFFSPLLFDAFFGAGPEELGFDSRLLVWSFEEGEAKPSPELFRKASARLSKLGIPKSETLFTGNDMKNDIFPAADAGWKTVLFAGDRRSLRLRGFLPRPGRPAALIRDLRRLQVLSGIR